MLKIELEDQQATEKLGARLASVLQKGLVVFLQGDLGAGKTTFSRGLLRALGVMGVVKSPTYALVESYETDKCMVHHFDLYRIRDLEELEYLGLPDYLNGESVCLIEWPERADGYLQAPDLLCQLDIHGEQRIAKLTAQSDVGQHVLKEMGVV
jgi:tRNA threonylcarbamoyladenosine biosynthesis protein TsaE